MSKLMDGDRMIGIASGRIRDYYHSRVISLARIDKKCAILGKEFTVIWGSNPQTQKKIRVTVARFPYYDEEYRNETCDVNQLIPRR